MEETTVEARQMLNRVAREQMKERLMRDILVDMTVCELEGWNRMEYLDELKDMIDGLRGQKGER